MVVTWEVVAMAAALDLVKEVGLAAVKVVVVRAAVMKVARVEARMVEE